VLPLLLLVLVLMLPLLLPLLPRATAAAAGAATAAAAAAGCSCQVSVHLPVVGVPLQELTLNQVLNALLDVWGEQPHGWQAGSDQTHRHGHNTLSRLPHNLETTSWHHLTLSLVLHDKPKQQTCM
jgi:hypothetical protein